MSVIKFKRFTRLPTLQRIGRPMLARFFEKFLPELTEQNLLLPAPTAPDTEWFKSVAGLLALPEALPDSLTEALYAIDEMATPEGQEQVRETPATPAMQYPPAINRTWNSSGNRASATAFSSLLARIHNQQRLRRLTAFEYFGTPVPPERRAPLPSLNQATLHNLTAVLDPWFMRDQRGSNTSRIKFYRLQDTADSETGFEELWFLVRHGDLFTRAPKADEQKTEIMHFRPERDDVVVFSPTRDEIRINCRTRGERDLYVRSFGLSLRGREDYFSLRNTYTLEPLRTDGADSLQTDDIPGLEKITLRQIQVALECEKHIVTRAGEDLFQCPAPDAEEAIPRHGRLRCAAFDLHFTGCPKPRPLHIRPPNILKLGRHCDVHLVDRWLSRRGFRVEARW